MLDAPQTATPPQPFYDDGQVTIYHADCREVLPHLDPGGFAALVTDPPYGVDYHSNRTQREQVARAIANDADTSHRDAVLAWWGSDRPAVVFGSPRVEPPTGTRTNLVWHKPGSGMGDLNLPWKPDYEFVHIFGDGYAGERTTSVLSYPLRVFRGDLRHPHQKPVPLMVDLLRKLPPGPVIDPFAGSGATLQAAVSAGRRCVGIELVRGYCDLVVQNVAQGALPLDGGAA